MPQFKEIPAGAYDPDEVVEVTEESLQEAVESAQERVEEIRSQRLEVRATAPKGKALAALAETEQDFQGALKSLADAEKALGRFRGAGEGTRVAVGTATEKGRA